MINTPFPHLVLDDAFEPELVQSVASSIPGEDWPHWTRYDGVQERKRTCRDVFRLSSDTGRLFHYLFSAQWTERLRLLTGIEGLVADPTLHGGGLHCCGRGGFLDVHIDYALHPQLKLERRLNLVLFLNADWKQEWNGALELWNADATRRVKQIWPKFNRAVLWEPSDIAYHGHPDPLSCPSEVTRDTIAVYYVCLPRSSSVVRTRALFVPRR